MKINSVNLFEGGTRLKLANINQHVLQTLLFRFVSIAGGACTLFLIPFFLAADIQGVYYLFLSLSAIQIFFELGVSSVLTQFVSHEVANIGNLSDMHLAHMRIPNANLVELYRIFHRFYLVASLVFLVGFSVIGPLFLFYNSKISSSNYLPQFFVFSFLLSINLYLVFYQAVLEGLGCIATVSRFRKRQTLCGYLLFLVIILVNGQLWIVIALPLSAALFSSYLAFKKSGICPYLGSFHQNNIPAVYNWTKDIFPLQWRISLSWISGFFLFNLAIPLAFVHLGPSDAGKLGIGITIINSLQTLSLSMFYSIGPTISMSLSRGEFRSALFLFKRASIKSLAALFIFFAFFLISLLLFSSMFPTYAGRFPSVSLFLVFFMGAALNLLVSLLALYMRSYKREPMIWVSVSSAVITYIAIWNASYHGIFEIAMANLLVTALFSLPATVLVFKPYFINSSLNLAN